MSYLNLTNSTNLNQLGYDQEIAKKITIADNQKIIELDELERTLKKLKDRSVKFVILGVPEGIGPYANKGRNGAYGAWPAFLNQFRNRLKEEVCNKIILLGNVYLADLQRKSEYYDNEREKDRKELRRMVGQIDDRFAPLIRTIFRAGLIPVVIGGGHNNAYPLIREAAQLQDNSISCINLDLHADLRETDGRHSGNSFSYGFENDLLDKYYIFGLYENYHSEKYFDKVKTMQQEGKIDFSTYDQITKRFENSFRNEINRAINWLKNENVKELGLEVDLDSVEGVPASAITEVRIPLSFTLDFVARISTDFAPIYFNISEGAPVLGKRNSKKVVGDIVCTLIEKFITAIAAI